MLSTAPGRLRVVVVQNGTRFHEVTLGGSHIRFLWLGQLVSLPGVNAKNAFLNSAGNGTAIKTCTHYGPQGCPDLEKSRKIHENKESQLRFFDCFRFLKRKCPTG